MRILMRPAVWGFLAGSVVTGGAMLGADAIERWRDRAVVRVVDGDTVRVARGENVRLAGFDAPESRRGDSRCERERLAGIAATERLLELIGVGRVTVTLTGERDRWGRPLAEIMIAGRPLAEIAIAEGWGVAWDGRGAKPNWCGEGAR